MTQPTDTKAVLAKLGIEETVTDLTGSDVYMSILRFERLAVVHRFEHPIEWLMENHGDMEGTTALIYVHMRREGMPDREAFRAATALNTQEILGYFAADDAKEEAKTPAGKDGPPVTSSPTSSPTTGPDSASSTDSLPASTTS